MGKDYKPIRFGASNTCRMSKSGKFRTTRFKTSSCEIGLR
ncbi:unnamed protein product [Brassica oleracea]